MTQERETRGYIIKELGRKVIVGLSRINLVGSPPAVWPHKQLALEREAGKQQNTNKATLESPLKN